MCGISGTIGRKDLTAEHRLGVLAMNEASMHRGPDDSGEFWGTHVGLAMRRLSIIDIQGSPQPLFNEEKTIVLVANAEIYNYKELREGLRGLGHDFSTEGDCETIVHLYEQYGTQCVDHLRGMFAFALWDSERNRLMLARDRMGEKPLYLYESNETLIFASEMKALLSSGAVPFELDAVSIDMYFHFQYVPEPRTPIRGVRKLDAAHWMTIDVDSWSVSTRCYWNMEDAEPISDNAAEVIREELEDVSRLVIRSDVPIGIALSGGLDSGAIAALAATKCPEMMHAFTVGYPGHPAGDERADARELANLLDMPFHGIELSVSEMVSFFPELVRSLDDPIADISAFGYYSVSKAAREQGVPVLMQGQGGDELFWGYPWVREAVRQSERKAAVRSRGLLAMPKYLRFSSPMGRRPWQIRIWLHELCGLRSGWREYRRHLSSPPDRAVFYDTSPNIEAALMVPGGLYTPQLREKLHGSSPLASFELPESPGRVDIRITKLICDTYLRENGITQGDRLSMASSVELRLPLLDYRFVEKVIGLRKHSPDHGGPPKSRLRHAFADLLPRDILDRPKRGFAPPTKEWHDALLDKYGEDLPGGYLVSAGVLTDSAAELGYKKPWQKCPPPMLFKILVLESWCRGILEQQCQRGAK